MSLLLLVVEVDNHPIWRPYSNGSPSALRRIPLVVSSVHADVDVVADDDDTLLFFLDDTYSVKKLLLNLFLHPLVSVFALVIFCCIYTSVVVDVSMYPLLFYCALWATQRIVDLR